MFLLCVIAALMGAGTGWVISHLTVNKECNKEEGEDSE